MLSCSSTASLMVVCRKPSLPLLSWWYLPAGFSVKQLSDLCQALSDAADKLPNLRHLSMGMELDALLSSNGGAGLSPLAGCTQLTSLSLAQYQVSTAGLAVSLDRVWHNGQHGRDNGFADALSVRLLSADGSWL